MASSPSGEPVPNYLVQSILITICCCLPFGIPAIIYATKVDGLLRSGDRAGAVEASQAAKKWCWIGFGTGIALQVVVFVGYIVMMMFAVGMAVQEQNNMP